MGLPIRQDRKRLYNRFHTCSFTAPPNQGSKQENRITTALVLFTVCPWEEVRLKFVIANVHQDCWKEVVVFFNAWKATFLQKDTIHALHSPCWFGAELQGNAGAGGCRGRGLQGQGAALTHGAHVPAVRCHHEWRSARAVGGVHLRAVAQQQLQTLHVVGKGCGVQGRPGGATPKQLGLKKGDVPTSPKISQCNRFYLLSYQIRVVTISRLW